MLGCGQDGESSRDPPNTWGYWVLEGSALTARRVWLATPLPRRSRRMRRNDSWGGVIFPKGSSAVSLDPAWPGK